MGSADREMLTSFLSASSSASYVPASGQVVGILKQMRDTMEKALADITASEKGAISDHAALVAAKTKEIEAHGAAIESKTGRSGRAALEIVELKEDLDDTSKALADDRAFSTDLGASCEQKKKEWEVRLATRAEEQVALADTIKLLNDDDALELFGKTLPSPSLLQTQVSGKAVRRQAMDALRAMRGQGSGSADPRMDLVMMALAGRGGGGFDKVLKMVDDMVVLLGREQTDDDAKKAYCEKSLDKTE